MTDSKNKRVVVTAAASGIGAAIAEAFATTGATLAICDIDSDSLSNLANRLREKGIDVVDQPCDVGDVTQLKGFVATVLSELGTVDVLVNNAGGSGPGDVTEIGLEEWATVMAVNLDSAFILSQAFIPGMREQGWGRLIQIASLGGKRPFPHAAAYSTSKAAMIALTRSMAIDFIANGITSNAVCPSWTRTDMAERFANFLIKSSGLSHDEAFARMSAMNPHQRILEPSEIAEVVLMLAGDSAGSINGEAISVDGGASV